MYPSGFILITSTTLFFTLSACKQDDPSLVNDGRGGITVITTDIGGRGNGGEIEAVIATGGVIAVGGMATTGGTTVVGGTTTMVTSDTGAGGTTQAIGSTADGGNTSGFSTGGVTTGGSSLPTVSRILVNGIQWADTHGNPIQAHGGGVVIADGHYYWFGENRNPNGTFFAVSAYKSNDLVHWEFVNHVLRNTSSPGLNPANVERPKVVFNKATQRFVMWMHWENGTHYGEARAAVASSDTIAGEYTFHGSFRPLAESGVTDHGKPGYMSRDCGLFVDDDGTGYFISASNENTDLNLYRLTTNYLGIEKLVAVLFKGGHREAPVLWKRHGVYFLLTSGATGWSPNQAQYATTKSLTGSWSAMAKVGDATTYHSQSTYVLPVQNAGTTDYWYMGDRWAGAWKGKVNDSTYVWLPLTFPTETTLAMSFHNSFSFNTSTEIVHKSQFFRLINHKSAKALDCSTEASGTKNRIIQSNLEETTTQVWNLVYNGAGFFRLKNVKTNKVLDVLDESTADGAPLGQWEDLGGDNQLWTMMDLGNGRYKIRNKNSGKFVAVAGGATQVGTTVEQRSGGTGEEQEWCLSPMNN
jgi:hypothetical protein